MHITGASVKMERNDEVRCRYQRRAYSGNPISPFPGEQEMTAIDDEPETKV